MGSRFTDTQFHPFFSVQARKFGYMKEEYSRTSLSGMVKTRGLTDCISYGTPIPSAAQVSKTFRRGAGAAIVTSWR